MLTRYATLSSDDAGEQIWYLDSATTSHMILDDGKLLQESPYSRSSLVMLEMELHYPLSTLAILLYPLL